MTHSQENAVWMSDAELEAGKEIEQKIVTDLIRMHQDFITAAIVQGTDWTETAIEVVIFARYVFIFCFIFQK